MPQRIRDNDFAVNKSLPYRRAARTVNVSSGAGSLARNADPAHFGHSLYGANLPCVQDGAQCDDAFHAYPVIYDEDQGERSSPGFIKTNLNNYAVIGTAAEGSREVVRLALVGTDGLSGTFTRWENQTIPW